MGVDELHEPAIRVRAGVLSAGRLAGYLGLSLLVAVLVGAACQPFGTVISAVAGLAAGGAALAVLLSRDAVWADADGIRRQTVLGSRPVIAWDSVSAAQFVVDGQRWVLSVTSDTPLVLLNIAPVTGPVRDPAAMYTRERLIMLRELLRRNNVPTSLDSAVAEGLAVHWGLAGPGK